MATTAVDWIQRFAERVGASVPDAREVGELLAMAGTAAHASERTAAPISTWLAARAGLSPEEALVAAKALAAEIERDGAGAGEAEAGAGEAGAEAGEAGEAGAPPAHDG